MRKTVENQKQEQETFLNALVARYAGRQVTRKHIKSICKSEKISFPYWYIKRNDLKIRHGVYSVPSSVEGFVFPSISEKKERKAKIKRFVPLAQVQPQPSPTIDSAQYAVALAESFVPRHDPLYVKFGYYKDLKAIIDTGRFYPVFISGLSGNGKTFMVEQVCAELGRDLFRVNITVETDEDDLLGGFRLIDGCTKWFDGPVVKAMKAGAVLLLDEVDLASTKILCLQPVLEGKGIFLKKINQFIHPAPGFTVISTANTKGQGSDTGKFVGANLLNEAFLERFPITFEQDYPSASVEGNILSKVLESFNIEDSVYVQLLTTWAELIRRTYKEEAVTEVISTRRLVHICNAYAIFGDKKKALELCLNRFDETVKESFTELYNTLETKENDKVQEAPQAEPTWAPSSL